MATHIVCWNFKDTVAEAEKPALKAAMKEKLTGLVCQVPGLLTAEFIDAPAAGSNREIALITTHASLVDIEVYAKDPRHIAVADAYVRPYTADRACVNF